jgi:(p)ppGpp synthase/HD superfamily hydrolase
MSLYTPHANAVINHAIQFAVIAHGNQVRKGNEHLPYVFHCIDVANEIFYYSGLSVEEMRIASIIAILHDTIEDTPVTQKDISDQFGDNVAYGVGALSKSKSISCAGDSKMDQLTESIARIKQFPKYVWAVKLADRISNLKSFPAMWGREKISAYLNEASLIARELGEASEGLHARLLASIAQTRVMLSIMS